MHSSIYQITTNKKDEALSEYEVYDLVKHFSVDYATLEDSKDKSVKWLFDVIGEKVTRTGKNTFKVTKEQLEAMRKATLEKYINIATKALNEPENNKDCFWKLEQILDDYCTFIIIDEYQSANKIDRWLVEDAQPDVEYYIKATYDYHI